MHTCTVSMFLRVTIDVPVSALAGLRLYFALFARSASAK
jgi:hypothetical protein